MYTDQTIMLNEVSANGASTAVPMLGLRHIEFAISMTGFTGTVKFAGSNSDVAPNFANAASLTNQWDFIKTIDQNDGSGVNGSVGKTGTATTAIYQLEANTNAFKWVAAIVSGYSAGTLTVKAKGINDSHA